MGKGDKKSRRGKIHIGSYGTRRPQKSKHYVPVAVAAKLSAPAAKLAEPKAQKSEKISEAATAPETVAEVTKPKRKTTAKQKEEKAPE